MNIALDAFGGDYAPRTTVDGAIQALTQSREAAAAGLKITLVGNRKKLLEFLPAKIPDTLEFLDIPEETPTEDVATDEIAPESPIRAALHWHAEGRFDAFISAGSTGVQVLASILELGKCSGITRPAIGSVLPTARGRCLVIDVGASLVASPHHLVQFALMGAVYVRELLGLEHPSIGLLNVGVEATAGHSALAVAHRLLSESGLDFRGFVEGRDIPAGAADVVVTNGFVGNILLKYTEGLPEALKRHLGVDAESPPGSKLFESFDFHSYGGEPLLGVRGVSIIAHGASSDRAIAAAVIRATRIVPLRLYERIEAFLEDRFSSYFSRVKYLRSFRRGSRRHFS
jgi:glycerol-3-phosphate acyltransferase PlsX